MYSKENWQSMAEKEPPFGYDDNFQTSPSRRSRKSPPGDTEQEDRPWPGPSSPVSFIPAKNGPARRTPVGPGVHALPLLVDQAGVDQEHPHPQRLRRRVLGGVVAHHEALPGPHVQLLQDLPVVARAGLAEAAVLIGGDQFEVGGLQPHPAQAAPGGRRGEDGVGGQHHPPARRLDGPHRLGRLRVEAAELPGPLELHGVELLEQGPVRQGLLPKDLGEPGPKDRLVGAAAVVAHHGGGARPDGVDQLFGVVAPGGQLLGQQAEVAAGESLHVHGQQGAVQVEQYVLDVHRVLS